jgi:radical SAM protein with 4Fe4S-binding SPASM domain
MAVEENLNEIKYFIDFCEKEDLPYRFDSPAPVGNARINKLKNVSGKIMNIKSRFESSDLLKAFRFNSCMFDQATILANGDVTFCILSNRTFNDHILGNINRSILKEIWFGKKVQHLFGQTNIDTRRVCKDCEYKYLCGGLCPFSSKFHKLHVKGQGIPNCSKFKNKTFRSWQVKC